MPLTSEVLSAVSLLESLQGSLRGCDEPRLGVQYTNDLNTLISVLHNPVLNKIIAIQDSIHDLKKELARHPSLLPSDFDISPRRGELTLHFPSDGVEEGGGGGGEIYPKKKSSKSSADISQGSSHELIDADRSVHNSYETHPLRDSEPPSPQRQWLKNGRGPDGDSEGELAGNEDEERESEGVPESITNATLDTELRQLIRVAAEGRQIHHIQLYKPEGTSLGFSVVGLKSEQRGDLGIYVQEIQPTGIAAKDGRLQDGDQILAIDGQILDSFISHQQAISILQKANKLVDLVVARAPAIENATQPQPEDDDDDDPGEEFHPRQVSLRRKQLAEQQQLESTLLREREQLFIQQQHYTTTHIVPPSTESRTSNMLNTEWAQVEVIHLVNDGSGLGFGIIGGRSTGVVVKTILPGGVADREGRLQSGDHILQIGEVNLRGMGSDQVASVLRQAGSHVRLVVARPVESASPDFQIGRTAPIVETRVLNDPEELDRHLNLISNGFPSSSIALSSITVGNGGPASSSTSSASTVPAGIPTNGHSDYLNGDSELLTVNNQIASTSAAVAVVASDGHLTSAGGSYLPMEAISPCDENTVVEGGEGMSLADLPEMENIDLDLAKDHQGLGITIAGYVCEREELSGIFVKSINAGSAADRSGHVQVNDQIVEVDGKTLTGLSNHAAVEVLRSTGLRVRLRLARYLRGPKFEQLQQAIANSELKTTPSTPNPPRAPHGEVPSSEAIRTALGELEAEDQHRSHESLVEAYNPSVAPAVPLHPSAAQQSSVGLCKDSYEESTTRTISTSDVVQGSSKQPTEVRLDDIELLIDADYAGELLPSVENAIIRKWSRIVGPDLEIVVAQLKKFERGGGLGISLEGTVDVEDGREVRPHHYIRSILPDGPVGRDSRLKSGDEFLEVNNQKLLGLNHVEVVTILKELPQAVRIVCGRRVSGSGTPIHSGDAVAHREAFGARNVLGGSLQSLVPSSERLVKAKSDGSLASSTTNANSDSNSFTKVKSRSLEPLTGLAMWSTEPQHIELIKGERGLGFSILDYQDPMNPQETVIVIRSLVPGGVAEKDGRLIPGDRLVGVNGASLEKASLDEAVAELKGAPKGPVIISVAKPISVLESPGQLDLILGDLGSSEAGSDVTEEVTEWNQEDDYTQEQIEERRKRRKTNDSVISTSSVPPALPVTEPPMLDRDASVLMVPVATERLIGGSSSSSATNSAAPSSGEEEISPLGSPVPHPRIHSLAHTLPRQLERVIKVRKGGDQLGINIDIVDQGVNGVVVSSLVRGGAVHKDGRIRAGDLIVSVNNETMRNITNSQARAILRRTQLVSTDVCIAFIPGEEAAKHRETRLQSFKKDITETAQERISQRSFASRESSEDELLGISSDLTRSATAPSFITRQLTRSRDPSQEETLETQPPVEIHPAPAEPQFIEARPSSSLSDVSGAAATVVTLKNAISEVLGTEDRSRTSQKTGREETEEGPFTITFSNITEAGLVRGDLQTHSEEALHAPAGVSETPVEGRNTTSSTTPPAMDGKHWGPERVVEVKRDENGSLGISIVGGKVDISWSGSSVTGIFVKNVLANSPAGRSGLLKTGDRILEVEGVDLRTATHEKAVDIIKKTGNPVTFVVQSLVQWNVPSTPVSRETSRLGIHGSDAVSPARTPTPELIQSMHPSSPESCGPIPSPSLRNTSLTAPVSQPGLSDQKKQELEEKDLEQQKTDALRKSVEEESSSEEEEDTRNLQGRTTSRKGVEIDRASAAALKRSKEEKSADPEEEDKFGYTFQKVQKKYSSPDGEVHLVDLQKGSCGLGISLAGHKDRSQMSVYVCGMNPSGNAFKDGRIQVGDEILEVNGYVVEGRSHLNASTIFKGIPGPSIKIIVRRRKSGLQDMAVKPLTHFPVTLEDESPEEKYARFKGLTKFVMKKGQFGLGIMIIEGKHAEYGNGIFISDLQEGSTASEAGLMVGDMILTVNKEEMIGVDYEMAASILKKTEGVITMWVANAARVTGSTTTSSTDGIPGKIAPPTPAKNAEPKKPEIPPKPSVLPKPPIPAKPLSIHASTAATHNPVPPHHNPISLTHPSNPLPTEGNPTTLSSSSLTTALHSSGSLRTTMGTTAHPPEEPPADPSSAAIKPGRETTIEIVKEKMGLGLSIVGGTDTLLGAIIIHEVYPDGAAAKDGRLKPGDQILEVNSEDFRVITHQKALSVLRQTPSKVKMVVYREEGTQKEEDLYDVISVQLTKKSGKGLGLSIVGRKNGPGVFISDLVPGGVAESDGRLMQGDQILEVNDKDLRTASQEQAAAILKCAPASVSMKIGRLKPGKKISPSINPTWPMTISEGPPRTPSSLSPEFPFPHPPLLISPHTIPQLQSSSSSSPLSTPQAPPPNIVSSVPPNSPLRTVVLERGDDGLGFSIVGGFGSNLGDLPIYVKSVFDRGAAAREGSLRRGDQILQVNGHSLAGLTHAQAVGILKDAKGTVTLTILPSK